MYVDLLPPQSTITYMANAGRCKCRLVQKSIVDSESLSRGGTQSYAYTLCCSPVGAVF